MPTVETSLCPRFHRAVELIGRRWTGAILRVLLQGEGGRARYHTLRAAVPEISDRMLSERLRELEAEGLVRREVQPDTPVRVEYSLTDKGRALEPALDAIGAWAERWVSGSEAEGAGAGPQPQNVASAPQSSVRGGSGPLGRFGT